MQDEKHQTGPRIKTEPIQRPDDRRGAVQTAKAALRERLLSARAELPAQHREAGSAAICRRLERLPELAGLRRVMGYSAFGAEASVDAFLGRLLEDGVTVYLPWVRGDRAGITGVRDLDADLAPGWRGVREPRAGRGGAVQLSAVEAVLAPGVAFDRTGSRLGYGGGHFDRLLSQVRRGVPVIGIAFEAQLVDVVPTEPHDRRVQAIVTEAGVVRP